MTDDRADASDPSLNAADFALGRLRQLPNSAELLSDLRLASLPHWFDSSMAEKMSIANLDKLLELGVLRGWQDGSFAVADFFRSRLFASFYGERPEELRNACGRWAALFSKRMDDQLQDRAPLDPTFASTAIEMLSLDLASGRAGANEHFLESGLNWKGEPSFALDSLRRLITGARELEALGLIDERGSAYTDLLSMFGEGRSARPAEEADKLSSLLQVPATSRRFKAEVHLRLAQATLSLGYWETAREQLESAEALFADFSPGVAEALRMRGRLYLRSDLYVEAQACFEQALDQYSKMRMPVAVATSQKGLAEVQLASGQTVLAEENLFKALSIFEANDAHLGSANTDTALANLMVLKRDPERAHFHAARAVDKYTALKHGLGVANATRYLGAAQFLEGDFKNSYRSILVALDASREWGSRAASASARLWYARLFAEAGDAATALSELQRASIEFEAIEDRHGLATCMRELGRLSTPAVPFEDKLTLTLDAIALFQEMGSEAERLISDAQLAALVIEGGYPPPFSERFVRSLLGAIEKGAVRMDLRWLYEYAGHLMHPSRENDKAAGPVNFSAS
jgi:tetratricopeptide (TPR) repeat protein